MGGYCEEEAIQWGGGRPWAQQRETQGAIECEDGQQYFGTFVI